MTEQWQELKETITEMRDSDGTGTQQDVCRFLVNYMNVLEKQMQEPILDKIRAEIKALNPVDYVSMNSYEGHRGVSDMKDDVLQVIDKYMAESGDKE